MEQMITHKKKTLINKDNIGVGTMNTIIMDNKTEQKKAIVTNQYANGFSFGDVVYYQGTFMPENGTMLFKFGNASGEQYLSVNDFCLLVE